MKSTLLYTFIACASLAFSQKNPASSFLLPSPQIGQAAKLKSTNKKIIGAIHGNLFALGRNTPNGNRYSLYKYNDQLQLVGQAKIFDGNISNQFIGILKFNNRILRATSNQITNSSKGLQATFDIQPINTDNLHPEGSIIGIEKISYPEGRYRPSFFWSISPDSSKIAIFSVAKTASPFVLNTTVRVLDQNLQTIWGNENTFHDVGTDFPATLQSYFQVDNMGNIVLLFEPTNTTSTSEPKDYKVINLRDNGRTAKEYLIPVPKGLSLLVNTVKSDGDKYIFVLGEYFKLGSRSIGTYFTKINTETATIENTQTVSINSHLKQSHEDEGLHPEDFVLKNVIPTDDGGFVYLFEYTNTRVSWQVHRTHIYGDLLAQKVDINGKELWSTLIPKFQHGVGSDHDLSFTNIKVGNNIYLIFNQNKGKKNSYYNTIVQILETGKIQKGELIDHAYFPLIPQSAYTYNNRLILFSSIESDKTKSVLIQLDFNKKNRQSKLVQEVHSTKSDHSHHKVQYRRIRNTHQNSIVDHYFGFNFSMGINNFRASSGQASVYFPYTATNSDGITSSQTADFSRTFSPTALGVFGFGVEYQNKFYYGEGGFELPFYWKSYLTNDIGYGNLYLGTGLRFVLPQNKFAIRIGALFLLNNIYDQLGRLDNYQETLDINNDSNFGPTFKVQHHSRYSSYTSTETAYYSQVAIDQTSLGIAPKIGLEYIDNEENIIYRLNVGYNLSFSYDNDITIRQCTSSGSYSGHGIDFETTDAFVNYHFIGNNSINAPYTANNFLVNFQIVGKISMNSTRNGRRW